MTFSSHCYASFGFIYRYFSTFRRCAVVSDSGIVRRNTLVVFAYINTVLPLAYSDLVLQNRNNTEMRSSPSSLVQLPAALTATLLLLQSADVAAQYIVDGLECSIPNSVSPVDPNLIEMKYDVGDGEKTSLVYVEPKITDFYDTDESDYQRVTPKFNGFAGKFINMSKDPVTLYWYVVFLWILVLCDSVSSLMCVFYSSKIEGGEFFRIDPSNSLTLTSCTMRSYV